MTIATLIMAQETGLALYAWCRGGLLVLLGAVIGMLLMRTSP
ncbi:MAG: hypothetical protein PHY45_04280 [Rhodocyclaceae bacterium]|nr:hypothetical protein [Rhodocyclaceae bacterium]